MFLKFPADILYDHSPEPGFGLPGRRTGDRVSEVISSSSVFKS